MKPLKNISVDIGCVYVYNNNTLKNVLVLISIIIPLIVLFAFFLIYVF